MAHATTNPFEKQAPIPGISHVIAVGSGKGGVGKSTVAVNLAIALAKKGHRVGLLDADIYGPSIPRMLGCLNQKPEIDASNKIIPLERFNLKLMSIGFLVDEDAAIIWRGPMLFKALEQMLRDVAWGDLDFLVIDLPPGTGDVPLTLAQKTPITGGITVCTPQNVALADCKKSIDMFKRLAIPILGMVENMSYLLSDSGEKTVLFPRGSIDNFLSEQKIEKLAEIPFSPKVAVACETGIPFVESFSQNKISDSYMELALKVVHLSSKQAAASASSIHLQ